MYKRYQELLDKTRKTSYQVCKDIGMPQATVSSWKVGRSIPKVDTLKLLADYFGVTVDYFVHEIDEIKNPTTNMIFHIRTLDDLFRMGEIYLDDPNSELIESVHIKMGGQDFLNELRKHCSMSSYFKFIGECVSLGMREGINDEKGRNRK